MTTIAWDGVSLAADRNMGGSMNQRKIFKLKNGGYLAGAGYMDDLMEVARWIDRGMKDVDNPFIGKATSAVENESEYLYVDARGTAYWLTNPWLRPVKVNEKCCALGSGGEFALGAMYAGANARKAVSIACQLDYYTGKGIDVVKVKASEGKRT